MEFPAGIMVKKSSKHGFFPSSGLYNCRKYSTNRPLFMQNKANFKNLPMSAKPFTQTTYENFRHFCQPKNKANSKPNKANFKNAKNGRNLFYTKGLRTKNDLFPPKKTKPNQSQFPKRQKMNINSAITKYYENNPLLEAKKTKPKRTQFSQGQGAFRGLCSAEFLSGLKYGKAGISGFRETEIT